MKSILEAKKMNCYFHPEVESVVTCANCGVALCRESEQTAFYRSNHGKGQAFCKNCSLEIAKTDVTYLSRKLIINLIKLVICSILIITGIVLYKENDSVAYMVVCWAIAGIIFGTKRKKEKNSTDSVAWLAMMSGNDGASAAGFTYFIFGFIGTVIGYTIAGPVMCIIFAIKLIIDFVKYNREKKWLTSLQASM